MAPAESWLGIYRARATLLQADVAIRQNVERAATLLVESQPMLMSDGQQRVETAAASPRSFLVDDYSWRCRALHIRARHTLAIKHYGACPGKGVSQFASFSFPSQLGLSGTPGERWRTQGALVLWISPPSA